MAAAWYGDMVALVAADVVRGGGGNSSGGRQRQWRQQRERAAGAQRESMYVFFLQIHFLHSFLCRSHTDQIPDGLLGKVPAEQES